MTLREKSHREDHAGMQIVVDQVVDASGNALASSMTPQTATAANAGVAATDSVSVVTAATRTATTGSLPTPDGTTLFSDTSTPTVVELLDAVCETGANVAGLITENAVFKTALDALILENATFKVTINSIITKLTSAGVFT